MNELQRIAQYFRVCYQVDFKAINIPDFFGKQVSDQLAPGQGNVLTGKWTEAPVDTAWGKHMEQQLAVHSQEKALYAGAFFIKGRMKQLGKSRRIFAPLYIYPVQLSVTNDVYYFSIETENLIINPAFLIYLKSINPAITISQNEFSDKLPKGYLGFDQIHQLETVLGDLVPELELEELATFPEFSDEIDLAALTVIRKKNLTLRLISALCIGLFNKPSGSRGILNELTELSETVHFSSVLKELFLEQSPPPKKVVPRRIFTPVTLSDNQLDIFHSFDQYQSTLVVGPPGTGKSFTIAALTADLISHGKSVLIASKNDQAGKVIAKKIEEDFGLKNMVLKTASGHFKNSLKTRLENISHGLSLQRLSKTKLNALTDKVINLALEEKHLEEQIGKQAITDIKRGAFFANFHPGILQNVKKKIIEYKLNNTRFQLWELLDQLKKITPKKIKATRILLKKSAEYYLYEAVAKDRRSLEKMISGLQMESGNLMQEKFMEIDFQIILRALPAWVVNAVDVHKSLPLIYELFDVVIIDEATQCDIASSIPLLQRAKKVIVVGDPKQLRHLSFLSGTQQQKFAKQYKIDHLPQKKIDYRNGSLLDLISSTLQSQKQVHFLDEHYRSMPDIINFSNQHFYENRLKIMTANPISKKEKSVFQHPVSGIRNEKGQNPIEASAMLTYLKTIIRKEKSLPKKLCQSIGILSPFRSQVTFLKSMVSKSITAQDIRRHQLLIGTPHHFQGEERDLMFLSFVVDDKTHPSTYLYLNKADVFNVSVTRARLAQHIFFSVSLRELPPNYLLTQYLQQTQQAVITNHPKEKESEEDEFMKDVTTTLKKWKVSEIFPNYAIAGIEVDLVVVHQDKSFCIDLVGYPGDFEDIWPVNRIKLMSRIGIPTFTLPYTAWYTDKKRAKTALKKFLEC